MHPSFLSLNKLRNEAMTVMKVNFSVKFLWLMLFTELIKQSTECALILKLYLQISFRTCNLIEIEV